MEENIEKPDMKAILKFDEVTLKPKETRVQDALPTQENIDAEKAGQGE